jgi:hypothetical protein
MLVTATLALAVAPACGDRRGGPPPPGDAPRARRVIERPRSALYPLPPHAIRSDGVGPYKLGEALATVLYAVPSAPGVEVLDVPRVVRHSVIRVEDNRVVVGGDPVVTSFVGVLAPEVARTESGVEVGMPRDELGKALGAAVVDPVRAVDPRLIAAEALPGVRFVVEHDAVVAVLVTGPRARTDVPRAPGAPVPAVPACKVDPDADAVRTALGGEPARLDCLTETEAVAAIGDEVVVISTGDKPRRLVAQRLPDLVFAGATHGAGRHEVIAVTAKRDARQLVTTVIALRWEGGRLARTLDETAYQLTAQSAGWLGARLEDLDLLLEVEARADMIVVSGVLLGRAGPAIRLAVPLTPSSLARRKRSVTDTPPPPGDASVQPLGDADDRRDQKPDAAADERAGR